MFPGTTERGLVMSAARTTARAVPPGVASSPLVTQLAQLNKHGARVRTLAEVRKCANAGIRVSSFALIEDYFYLSLVNFVEEMARVSHGVAAYCSTDDIGNLVFESFIGGRRTRRREH